MYLCILRVSERKHKEVVHRSSEADSPTDGTVSPQADHPAIVLFQYKVTASWPRKSRPLSQKTVKQEEFSITGVWGEVQVFLFYSGLQLIAYHPLTWGRVICFAQSTDLNINLIQKHSYRNSQNNVWPNIWAPVVQSSCPKRLAITSRKNKWL